MMQVIFNADDFGRSSSINRAVLQAHRDGVLTSASLMVTGDAVEEAVALAHGTPTLAVGLHLVLSDGRPASPPAEIPHLLARSGRFPSNPARVWIQYIFSPAARAEMTFELRVQFERFAATGLPLDHVDAHQHLHMHPAVFGALMPLAGEYGASGVRLPRDDFWLAMRYDRSDAAIKAVWAVLFGILCRVYARDLDTAADHAGEHAAPRLAVTDRVYGLMQSGRMEESYVLRVIEHTQAAARRDDALRRAPGADTRHPGRGPQPRSLRAGWPMARRNNRPPATRSPYLLELYFHPSLAPQSEPLGPNPGDLATLLSPTLRRAIEAGGLMPASYATLERAE